MHRSLALLFVLGVVLSGTGYASLAASMAASAGGIELAGAGPEAIEVARNDEVVAFNTKSLKYHCRTCSAAKRCTRNCVDVVKVEAKKRGGVACTLCGGSCRR